MGKIMVKPWNSHYLRRALCPKQREEAAESTELGDQCSVLGCINHFLARETSKSTTSLGLLFLFSWTPTVIKMIEPYCMSLSSTMEWNGKSAISLLTEKWGLVLAITFENGIIS